MRTDNLQNYSSRNNEHLLGMAILVAFLMPHTSPLFLLINPLLCILLVLNSSYRKWSTYAFVVLFPVTLSLLINVQVAGLKAVQSTFIILLYFACFPFSSQSKVRNIYIYMFRLYYPIASRLPI